jgi:hypothetical protein
MHGSFEQRSLPHFSSLGTCSPGSVALPILLRHAVSIIQSFNWDILLYYRAFIHSSRRTNAVGARRRKGL